MPLPPLCPPGPPLSREQITRYSRHVLLEQLGRTGQRRLRGASVLVMGAGGLGAPILAYLGAAGVATIGVVDDDVVEITNLQRQVIHTSAGVGRAKVDSAADFVGGLNDDVQTVRHHLRMDESNALDIIGDYDLVLDGTDNFPTRYLVSDTCAAEGIPLIWGSILRFNAQVSVFWSRPPADARGPDGEPYPAVTLRDLFPVPPPEGTTPSCGEAGVLGAMCGQVGSLMAAEAIKLITGIGEPLLGRVAVLDVLAARWHEVPLRPAPARHAATALLVCAVPYGIGSWQGAYGRINVDTSFAFSFSVQFFLYAVLTTVIWCLGRMSYAADRRNAHALEEQAAEAARAVAAERLQLARDLHDILASAVTAMLLQAAGARAFVGTNDTRVGNALQIIEGAGVEAMRELQRLLGLLRSVDGTTSEGNAPGLEDLDDLIELARASGVVVDTTTNGEPRALDGSVNLAAYRDVQ